MVEFEIDKWSEIKMDASIYSVNHIGVYLGCGDEDLFPINIEYQLLVRRCNSDEDLCIIREFGREKAWGFAGFTTIEILEKEGAPTQQGSFDIWM